jgi:hypothetical protein
VPVRWFNAAPERRTEAARDVWVRSKAWTDDRYRSSHGRFNKIFRPQNRGAVIQTFPATSSSEDDPVALKLEPIGKPQWSVAITFATAPICSHYRGPHRERPEGSFEVAVVAGGVVLPTVDESGDDCALAPQWFERSGHGMQLPAIVTDALIVELDDRQRIALLFENGPGGILMRLVRDQPEQRAPSVRNPRWNLRWVGKRLHRHRPCSIAAILQVNRITDGALPGESLLTEDAASGLPMPLCEGGSTQSIAHPMPSERRRELP